MHWVPWEHRETVSLVSGEGGRKGGEETGKREYCQVRKWILHYTRIRTAEEMLRPSHSSDSSEKLNRNKSSDREDTSLPSVYLSVFLDLSLQSFRHGEVSTLVKICTFFKASGSDSKESAWNVGDLGSVPRSGRSPGEGNGYPLQYSCLENPMDRGAWWTAAHRVAQSQTCPSDWHFHFLNRIGRLGRLIGKCL